MSEKKNLSVGMGLAAVAVHLISRCVAPVALLWVTLDWIVAPLTRMGSDAHTISDLCAVALLPVGVAHGGGEVKIKDNGEALGVIIGSPLGAVGGVLLVSGLVWLLTH